jgi:hypothetical protein
VERAGGHLYVGRTRPSPPAGGQTPGSVGVCMDWRPELFLDDPNLATSKSLLSATLRNLQLQDAL